MKRYGSVIGLKLEHAKECKRLHAAVCQNYFTWIKLKIRRRVKKGMSHAS